jgi:hypothetical protein
VGSGCQKIDAPTNGLPARTPSIPSRHQPTPRGQFLLHAGAYPLAGFGRQDRVPRRGGPDPLAAATPGDR